MNTLNRRLTIIGNTIKRVITMNTNNPSSPEELIVLLKGCGYEHVREIPGQGVCGIYMFVFTYGLMVNIDKQGLPVHRYCYDTEAEAIYAFHKWDGVGHPPGMWIKQKGPHVDQGNPFSDMERLVQFSTPTCPPCNMSKQVIEQKIKPPEGMYEYVNIRDKLNRDRYADIIRQIKFVLYYVVFRGTKVVTTLGTIKPNGAFMWLTTKLSLLSKVTVMKHISDELKNPEK